MRVSLNTIKQFTSVDLSVDELVHKINQQLGKVEQVIDLNERYKDALIVKVVEYDKHPDADRLHVCKIDDGGTMKDVERDEDGLVQVVCGAPNVHADMLAIWLPPKSVVPASLSEKGPFVLDARELRGVMSNGMLAAADELAIGSDHAGILEINANEWRPSDIEIKPGASFAKCYGLDDTVIDIENKMFTHRPDLFGQLGVAREMAGIQHEAFKSPDWYADAPEFKSADGLRLEVVNEAKDRVPRFMAVAIQDVEVKPSPLWLQCALVAMGSKPINNIVDVTNYIMLLTAQPTHAYDYDKLRGHKLGVRLAKKGEKAELLNGKTYELDESDIVIVDGEGVVGLGGIMGGGNSEVSENTKNIVLEVGTFDMYAVRRSSMRHGLFTDALTRFNKGQSPLQNDHVMNLLMQSVYDVTDGKQASNVFDESIASKQQEPISVTPEFINDRLGLNLAAAEIKTLLDNVELKIDGELDVTPAFWRTDLELPEDVVEEVGRLHGFDNLPRELPMRSTKPAPRNAENELRQTIRQSMKRSGANEVLTYSFVHENIIRKAGQDVSEAYQLSNALSPDLQYYRLSVLPSLLDKVHANVKAGHDEFALFEIGKAHNKLSDKDSELPVETSLLDMVYTSKKQQAGAPYFRVKRLVMQLLDDLGISAVVQPVDKPMDYAGAAPFDLSRAGVIMTTDGQTLGLVGELKASVRRDFKLPNYTAGATLDIASLLLATNAGGQSYVPLSRFPSVTQDLSLKVPGSRTLGTVQAIVDDALRAFSDLSVSSEVISLYQPEASDQKTATFRFVITSYEKTLTERDATAVVEGVEAAVVAGL